MSRIRAKKSLAQNFLADRRYLAPMVAAAEVGPDDIVLEIGPGRGVLTRELAVRAAAVVAVELDDRLIDELHQTFAGQPHVHIIHGDILELDPAAIVFAATKATPAAAATRAGVADRPLPIYKVVANLPYYITSAVLRHLLEAAPPPVRAVVMVQWEVAQRICATPGAMSLLAISVQYYATPQLVQRVPAAAFSPRPKVDSAILRLDVHEQPVVAVGAERFFDVVRAGFSQKRKQLLNCLAAGLHLPKDTVRTWLDGIGIDPTRRAETLSLDEWERVCLARPPAQ